MATKLGDVSVGNSVYVNLSGVRTEFIVVHQGLPASLYDSSCDGTWILMKDIYEKRAWHSSDDSRYNQSTIHSYLNDTFLKKFDADIRSQIKTVKIPHNYWTTVYTGANGVSAQIFLLGAYELGWTTADYVNIPKDGACLSYFTGTAATDSKRIAYYKGTATAWWLRSGDTTSNTSAMAVRKNGARDGNLVHVSTYGIRPALIMPHELYVTKNGDISVSEPGVHRTLVDGTSYKIKGGRTFVGGTGYDIKKGRTLVGGTGYDIPFSKGVEPIYTGEYDLYGTPEQGWIEMLTSGTLTIDSDLPCDIYLLGGGCCGESSDFVYSTPTSFPVYGADGGAGGKYYELYGQNLKGSHSVTIGQMGTSSYGFADDEPTKIDTYSSASGSRAATGGSGATITKMSSASATGTQPTAGRNGRQPFTGNNPMNSGFASLQLGAGGGGGGFEHQVLGYNWKGASGGTYGGGAGSGVNVTSKTRGTANTGSGGGGGAFIVWDRTSGRSYGGEYGGSGIAIVRWGY